MVRLPDKLSTLGYGAFSGCANLTDVAFNDVLLRIEGAAFSNCTSLLDADLPDSVELMERNVFSGCTALRTGHYPLNLNQVGFDGLFSGCKNLTSFTIQEGVENLCGYFFKGANYLNQPA